MSLEPVQIFELEQPRCGLRFGVGDCSASGGAKCYNTFGTCPVKADFDQTGSIKWRFVKNRPGNAAFGDFSDPDNVATNGIGGMVSMTTTESAMNVGGALEGKSPFGIRSRFNATLTDIPWDDHVGDFYADERSLPQRMFWATWAARNSHVSGMYCRAYDGYQGQALADMRQRVFALSKVDGPDGSGKVSITGYDPLRLVDDQSFPRVTGMQLVNNITASAETIRVYADPADVTDQFGNTATSYMRIGDEIIGYTGYSEIETGVYDLTGCIRGFDGTTPDEADAEEKVQRCARFDDWPLWRIQYYILTEHTPLPASFIDFDQWEEEGDTYVGTLRRTVTLASAVKVATLAGELCQQGCFNIWWDDAAQTIPFKAVRPETGTVPELTGDGNVMADSAKLRRDPSAQISRIFVYYNPRSPIASSQDAENYKRLSGVVEGDTENESAAGKILPLEIYARWVETEAHAYQIISRIFLRYREVPRFLSFTVSAKDREITIGDVCDVSLRHIVDQDGNILTGRWEVVAVNEIKAGEVYFLDLQTFDLIGRYAHWMANDAPDYLVASDAEKAGGFFWCDTDGEMSNGDDGYKWL